MYQKTQEYISNGREFTCEDLALSLLLDFSYENKLPVTIQNGSGIYSNHSNDFSDSETFINRILSTTAASDLQNNNNTLPVDSRLNASEGDIILFRNENGRAKHTQVIVAVEYYGSNPLYQIRQGNMWLPGSQEVVGSNPADSKAENGYGNGYGQFKIVSSCGKGNSGILIVFSTGERGTRTFSCIALKINN